MRVLLLGAGGMLGRDVADAASSEYELDARTHAELDVTDAQALDAACGDVRPDVVVNCAAYTDVDAAETHRDRAFAVNAEGPRLIGRVARDHGARLVVHFSTDYVFDGRASIPYAESAPTHPLGVYGASKLAGERALSESGAHSLIVRTQWLFGTHGRSFPRTMWQRAAAGQATRVVHDQQGRPTYTVDLAQAVWRLIARSATESIPRVVHIANAGVATWYDVARHVFVEAGQPGLVAPCTTAEYPTRAERPSWSVLDTTRYENLMGGSLPHWADALNRFVHLIRSGAPCA